MAVLDGVQGGAALAASVALQQGLRKHLLAAGGLDGPTHLVVRGVAAHNAVLPRHLVLQLLAERRVERLVLLDRRLQAAVDAAHLRRVLGRPAVGLALEHADAAREVAVHGHGLRGEGVQLPVGAALRRRVRVVERALLQGREVVQVGLDLVDAAIDVAALVEDVVGVILAAELRPVGREGLHLDVLACAGCVNCERWSL